VRAPADALTGRPIIDAADMEPVFRIDANERVLTIPADGVRADWLAQPLSALGLGANDLHRKIVAFSKAAYRSRRADVADDFPDSRSASGSELDLPL
jgi:hypothetical protein